MESNRIITSVNNSQIKAIKQFLQKQRKKKTGFVWLKALKCLKKL